MYRTGPSDGSLMVISCSHFSFPTITSSLGEVVYFVSAVLMVK